MGADDPNDELNEKNLDKIRKNVLVLSSLPPCCGFHATFGSDELTITSSL